MVTKVRYGVVYVSNVVKIPPVDGLKGSAVLLTLYSVDDVRDDVSDVKLSGPETEDTAEETAVPSDEMEAVLKDIVVVPGKVDVAMQLHALEILLGLHS